MSGKHFTPEPMNEALEKHYKDEKKRLVETIDGLQAQLNESKHVERRLRQMVEDLQYELSRTTAALADETLEKASLKADLRDLRKKMEVAHV